MPSVSPCRAQVNAGVRLALTIAFTCDAAAAIDDFLGRAVDDTAAERVAAERVAEAEGLREREQAGRDAGAGAGGATAAAA